MSLIFEGNQLSTFLKSFAALLLCFIVITIAHAQFSQPGELDTTFSLGRPFSDLYDHANPKRGSGVNDIVHQIAIQSDNKILISGKFTKYNGRSTMKIARLYEDGTLDTSFNFNNASSWSHLKFLLQSGDRILVAGNYLNSLGVNEKSVIRLNSNGSLDSSFVSVFDFDSTYGLNNPMVISHIDDKIYSIAYCKSGINQGKYVILRQNYDGSLDATFSPFVFSSIYDLKRLKVQNDNRILICGNFQDTLSYIRKGLFRLNQNGSLDTAFKFNNSYIPNNNSNINTFELQNDNKILVALNNSVFRINSSGSIDGTFDTILFNHFIYQMQLFNDSTVIVDGLIAKFNLRGVIDTIFAPITKFSNGVYDFTISRNGKIIVSDEVNDNINNRIKRIVRLNKDGTIDLEFNPSRGPNGIVYFAKKQSNGKLIIGGNFTIVGNHTARYLARLNSNGDFDTTFNLTHELLDPPAACQILSNDKILIGSYNAVSYANQKVVVRLNVDGSIDSSFYQDPNLVGKTCDLLVQPDGKIVVAGVIGSLNSFRKGLFRFNSDGTYDSIFNKGEGVMYNYWGSHVEKMTLQLDGKILIAGSFSHYNFSDNGLNRRSIARLNSDGTLDASFHFFLAEPFGPFYAIESLLNGDILYGGLVQFDSSVHLFGRLSYFGEWDTTFNLVAQPNSKVDVIFVQPDGKIITSGWFNEFSGIPSKRIVRLNEDGSVDTTFVVGSGVEGFINSISLSNNDKLIVTGDISDYNGAYVGNIFRINAGLLAPSNIPPVVVIDFPKIFPNPFIESVRVVTEIPFQYELYTIEGKWFISGFSSSPELSLSTSAWPSGTYILRIITEEGVSVRKLVKE